ncbi:hypothetical protein V6N13_120977 [Hibiscus sabdariffa]
MAHIQGREADIRVMSELNCALDKKEAILTELRNTNDNILENRNGGESVSVAGEMIEGSRPKAMPLLSEQVPSELITSCVAILLMTQVTHKCFSNMISTPHMNVLTCILDLGCNLVLNADLFYIGIMFHMATTVRNRSSEMEAFNSVHRSGHRYPCHLPDGVASVFGLIAMMIDQYKCLGRE